MKETGIVMSGNHPRLILEGKKTMTRRTWGLEEINKNPERYQYIGINSLGEHVFELDKLDGTTTLKYIKSPYGGVGDRLWMKETWAVIHTPSIRGTDPYDTLVYKADGIELPKGTSWQSPRFMPKKFARIWREITEVRAERLWGITPGDCLAEGIRVQFTGELKPKFISLWDFLNAKNGHGWDKNEWVFVIGFKEER